MMQDADGSPRVFRIAAGDGDSVVCSIAGRQHVVAGSRLAYDNKLSLLCLLCVEQSLFLVSLPLLSLSCSSFKCFLLSDPLLHSKLQDCTNQDTKVDLHRHDNCIVFNRLDMSQLHRLQEVEDIVPKRECERDPENKKGSNHPASLVDLHFTAGSCGGVDVEEDVDEVIGVAS